jgi:plastocyanin
MPGIIRNLNRREFTATAAATAAATALSVQPITAQDATPVDSSSNESPDIRVDIVATGLADPRFIATDGETVYFTESGTGGDTAVFELVGEGTPEPSSPVSQRGTTGKCSRVDTDGTVSVIAEGFQSYTFGGNGEIVGAAGIALDGNGKAYVAVGAPGPFISHIELTGKENALFEIDLETGEKRVVADLSPWEINENPDPMTIDSNLYGCAWREGVVYIADSGGNSILAVDVDSGEISTFAVPGGFEAPFLGDDGNPLRQGEAAIDSVPSGITLGPDDRFYVTYVTGGPFPAGFAPVDAFTVSGERDTFASGLSMVTDIAFSSDGTAYAVILSTDFINGAPGVVVRLSGDGAHTVVLDGLQVPNGIAFDANDTMYLTHKASFQPVGGGELLRVTGITTATGYPFTLPGSAEADATPLAETSDAGVAVHVEMGDMYYEPSEITIPADTDVVFTFQNAGFMQHDFFIHEPEVNSGVLAGGQTAEAIVNMPTGTYEFWCTQIGHREAGMIGTLIVE